MNWPQITMIVLLTLGVGIALAKNGEDRPPYSAWAAIIGATIQAAVLYAGGFFAAN